MENLMLISQHKTLEEAEKEAKKLSTDRWNEYIHIILMPENKDFKYGLSKYYDTNSIKVYLNGEKENF